MGGTHRDPPRSAGELAPEPGLHDAVQPESSVCRRTHRRGTESQATAARLMRTPSDLARVALTSRLASDWLMTMSGHLSVCLAGATGWAGSELARAIAHSEDLVLNAAVSRTH